MPGLGKQKRYSGLDFMHARLLAIVAAAGLVLSACATSSDTEQKPKVEAALAADAARIKVDMSFLADDALEGREAGTPGYQKASDYVAERFAEIGLAPGGDDDGWFQSVPLRGGVRVDDAASMTAFTTDGQTLSLERDEDYIVYGSTRLASSVASGQAVFAGFGIVAPEMGRDDYAGLDVTGKVVVVLQGAPKGIQTEERAYYAAQVAKNAASRGAVGLVTLETPTRAKVRPFKLLARSISGRTSMGWVQPDGATYTTSAGIAVSAYMSDAGARKLMADAPVSWDKIIEDAESEAGTTPAFTLPIVVKLEQASTLADVPSRNVIGVLEGSDPALKSQTIILSAHLDHIGITPRSMEADRINNGALDNAGGVATMLEAARALSLGERPRRSVMFIALTGEEKGLLGSQYFAHNPTVAQADIAANVNLDMPVLTYDFKDVVAFGGERSTMRSAVRAAAEAEGVALGEDPFPEQGIFTRSDHYRFVEQGIPAVFLATGYANGGEAAWNDHFARTYHRPADDMSNAINFDAAARFARINVGIARELANRDQRPVWNKGDFFARQFGGTQAAE